MTQSLADEGGGENNSSELIEHVGYDSSLRLMGWKRLHGRKKVFRRSVGRMNVAATGANSIK